MTTHLVAVVTGLISGGAATSIAQYRPGLYLVTVVALIGLIASATALLARRQLVAEAA